MSLFTRSLGSPNQMRNTDLCQGTHEIADMVTFGHVLSIYQSAQDFRNSRCILLVGTNMAASSGGQWQDTGSAVTVGGQQHDVVNYVDGANILATIAVDSDVNTTGVV